MEKKSKPASSVEQQKEFTFGSNDTLRHTLSFLTIREAIRFLRSSPKYYARLASLLRKQMVLNLTLQADPTLDIQDADRRLTEITSMLVHTRDWTRALTLDWGRVMHNNIALFNMVFRELRHLLQLHIVTTSTANASVVNFGLIPLARLDILRLGLPRVVEFQNKVEGLVLSQSSWPLLKTLVSAWTAPGQIGTLPVMEPLPLDLLVPRIANIEKLALAWNWSADTLQLIARHCRQLVTLELQGYNVSLAHHIRDRARIEDLLSACTRLGRLQLRVPPPLHSRSGQGSMQEWVWMPKRSGWFLHVSDSIAIPILQWFKTPGRLPTRSIFEVIFDSVAPTISMTNLVQQMLPLAAELTSAPAPVFQMRFTTWQHMQTSTADWKVSMLDQLITKFPSVATWSFFTDQKPHTDFRLFANKSPSMMHVWLQEPGTQIPYWLENWTPSWLHRLEIEFQTIEPDQQLEKMCLGLAKQCPKLQSLTVLCNSPILPERVYFHAAALFPLTRLQTLMELSLVGQLELVDALVPLHKLASRSMTVLHLMKSSPWLHEELAQLAECSALRELGLVSALSSSMQHPSNDLVSRKTIEQLCDQHPKLRKLYLSTELQSLERPDSYPLRLPELEDLQLRIRTPCLLFIEEVEYIQKHCPKLKQALIQFSESSAAFPPPFAESKQRLPNEWQLYAVTLRIPTATFSLHSSSLRSAPMELSPPQSSSSLRSTSMQLSLHQQSAPRSVSLQSTSLKGRGIGKHALTPSEARSSEARRGDQLFLRYVAPILRRADLPISSDTEDCIQAIEHRRSAVLSNGITYMYDDVKRAHVFTVPATVVHVDNDVKQLEFYFASLVATVLDTDREIVLVIVVI
jgi:hypothetical protein